VCLSIGYNCIIALSLSICLSTVCLLLPDHVQSECACVRVCVCVCTCVWVCDHGCHKKPPRERSWVTFLLSNHNNHRHHRHHRQQPTTPSLDEIGLPPPPPPPLLQLLLWFVLFNQRAFSPSFSLFFSTCACLVCGIDDGRRPSTVLWGGQRATNTLLKINANLQKKLKYIVHSLIIIHAW
jgi:hypothetical protein